MPKKALFITFEGTEGVGKSTQIRAVHDHFLNQGRRVFLTREPGGSPLSDGIRGVLLKSSSGLKIDPISELFLIEAARRQHVVDVLEKALLKNDVVLCDRFYDSTVAYQGGGRGIDLKFIHLLNDWATNQLKPDLTILLDMPAGKALKRALERLQKSSKEEAEDRFEKEAMTFHDRVREAYLNLAKTEPNRFFLVDASSSAEVISESIIRKIQSVEKKRK